MSIRRKIKIVRAAGGRYRYLIKTGGRLIFLSKTSHATVGDAKSAAKAKARQLENACTPAPLWRFEHDL